MISVTPVIPAPDADTSNNSETITTTITKGADIALARLLAEEGSQRERTRALVETLDLAVQDLDLFRIECFDVSHTAGEATQASCVVYQNHAMRSADYRRFNVEAVTPGDDYGAMRQVLMRRYAKLAEQVSRAEPGSTEAGSRLPGLVLVGGIVAFVRRRAAN